VWFTTQHGSINHASTEVFDAEVILVLYLQNTKAFMISFLPPKIFSAHSKNYKSVCPPLQKLIKRWCIRLNKG